MISQKIQQQITLVSYATVSNLFASMHNPRMRGENFSWNNFPHMAQSLVGTQILMSIDLSKYNMRQQDKAYEFARKTAMHIAQSLVKNMTE